MPLLSRLAVNSVRGYGMLSKKPVQPIEISYLVVAGGGGGGGANGDAGGGGGEVVI